MSGVSLVFQCTAVASFIVSLSVETKGALEAILGHMIMAAMKRDREVRYDYGRDEACQRST